MITKHDLDDDNKGSAMHQRWEAVNDEFLVFKNIPEDKRPCSSQDLCAFVYLDRLFPDDRNCDMVSAAEHDKIWLRVTDEQVATLTDADILYLTRCGVMQAGTLDGEGGQ